MNKKIVCFLLILLCICGFFIFKMKSSDIEQESDVNYVLFYSSLFDYSQNKTYIWDGTTLKRSEQKYNFGCYTAYPEENLLIACKKIGFNSLDDVNTGLGQVYIYAKYNDYEVYLLEGERWAGNPCYNIIFVYNDGNVQLCSYKHEIDERVDDIYSDKNFLYLFSGKGITDDIKIIKINTKDYTTTDYVIDFDKLNIEKFGVYINSSTIINGNIFFANRSTGIYSANVIKYNTNTQEYELYKLGDRQVQCLNVMNGDLYIVTKKIRDGNFKEIYIEKYDENFNMLSQERIEIDNYINEDYSVDSRDTHRMCNGKVYGVISSIDNRNVNYIYTYDINERKITFWKELKDNLVLVDIMIQEK